MHEPVPLPTRKAPPPPPPAAFLVNVHSEKLAAPPPNMYMPAPAPEPCMVLPVNLCRGSKSSVNVKCKKLKVTTV